jgi:YesN/AraC family two-component response regulator
MTKEHRAILKQATLLLIEDNVEFRTKFVRLLSLYVGTIYEASDGAEGLELYRKHTPSFIITDVEMSYVSGIELVQEIRKEDILTPIIITSAYSNKEYLLEAIKISLVDYLIKPIDQDGIHNALERVAIILQKNILTDKIMIENKVDNVEITMIKEFLTLLRTETITVCSFKNGKKMFYLDHHRPRHHPLPTF